MRSDTEGLYSPESGRNTIVDSTIHDIHVFGNCAIAPLQGPGSLIRSGQERNAVTKIPPRIRVAGCQQECVRFAEEVDLAKAPREGLGTISLRSLQGRISVAW